MLQRVEERRTLEEVRAGRLTAADVLERGAVPSSVEAERSVIRRRFKQRPVVSEGVAGSTADAGAGASTGAGTSSGSGAFLGSKRPRPSSDGSRGPSHGAASSRPQAAAPAAASASDSRFVLSGKLAEIERGGGGSGRKGSKHSGKSPRAGGGHDSQSKKQKKHKNKKHDAKNVGH